MDGWRRLRLSGFYPSPCSGCPILSRCLRKGGNPQCHETETISNQCSSVKISGGFGFPQIHQIRVIRVYPW
jgi:hypothetical protein